MHTRELQLLGAHKETRECAPTSSELCPRYWPREGLSVLPWPEMTTWCGPEAKKHRNGQEHVFVDRRLMACKRPTRLETQVASSTVALPVQGSFLVLQRARARYHLALEHRQGSLPAHAAPNAQHVSVCVHVC